MINALVGTLFKIILGVLSFLSNIVLSPFTILIRSLFPDIDIYFGSLTSFLNTYVFNGLAFAREVFIKFTGINRNLIGIAIKITFTYLGFSIANAGVRLIVSVYRLFKTGATD